MKVSFALPLHNVTFTGIVFWQPKAGLKVKVKVEVWALVIAQLT